MMNSAELYRILERLSTIHAASGQGLKWINGPVFEDISRESNLSAPTSEDQMHPLVQIHSNGCERENFPFNHSEFRVELPPKDYWCFRFRSFNELPVFFECEANGWGKTIWPMKQAAGGGEWTLLAVAPHRCEDIFYRFRVGDLINLDPLVRPLTVLPGLGLCSKGQVRPASWRVRIGLQVKKDVSGGQDEKANAGETTYKLIKKTGWLNPVSMKKIHLNTDETFFELDIAPPANFTSPHVGYLAFRRQGIRKSLLRVQFSLNYHPGPAVVEPEAAVLSSSSSYTYGEVVEMVLPLQLKGSGCLEGCLIGPGIYHNFKCVAGIGSESRPLILFTEDTEKLPIGMARSFNVLLQTDSGVVNRREFNINCQLNLIRLICYPTPSLTWKQVPWGSKEERVIEFIRSDTYCSVKILNIKIPDALANHLTVTIPENYRNKAIFVLDSRGIEPGNEIIEQILITVELSDGRQIKRQLIVKASVTTSHGTLCTQYRTVFIPSDLMTLRIANVGDAPLKISEMDWEKGRFRPVIDIRYGKTDSKELPPRTSRTLYFKPQRAVGWLVSRSISDRLRIIWNDVTGLNTHVDVNAILAPALWRPFIFCGRKIGALLGNWRRKTWIPEERALPMSKEEVQ